MKATMVPANSPPRGTSEGFEGTVAGLSLSDVIQINGHNRFSGCISVQNDETSGLIFFRDGEIIHAECGGQVGEGAFYEIMQWPGGYFELQPNVTTTSHSISRNSRFLLMEAHRLLDEAKAAAARHPPDPTPSQKPFARRNAVMARIRRIKGIEYAVLLTKEGARIGDDSFQAQTLEGQTAFLAMIGTRIGSVFQAGNVLAAVVEGEEKRLLLLSTKQYHISMLIDGETKPGVVENEVRKLLAPR